MAMFLPKRKLTVVTLLLAGGVAMAAPKGDEYPRLPRAVTEAPEWAKGTAPFDVEAFFKAPPRDQNAEPLYIVALSEFDFMFGCFPPGAEEDRRAEAIRPRIIRSSHLREALRKDPQTVSTAEIDALLAEYREGFRKLDEAQSRPRCVFQTGLGYDATLGHVEAAVTLAHVAALKLRRELEQGELDAAIRDVDRVLRLTRDLQPRGYIISQERVGSLIRIVHEEMVLPILAAPGLKVEHCDRLLQVLNKHAAKSIDGYAEGIKADYLGTRAFLLDLIGHQDQLRASFQHNGHKLPPGESIVAAFVEGDAGSVEPRRHPAVRSLKDEEDVEDLDAKIAQTTPRALGRVVDKLNAYYRALLDLSNVPYSRRLKELPDPARFLGTDELLSRVTLRILTKGYYMDMEHFMLLMGRMEATFSASRCLVALRRWELTHKAPPADLAAAVKDAGMSSVPIDPFDGRPMRMAVVEGEPVVYSVGSDGLDDGGRKESEYDKKTLWSPQPGDLIFHLPLASSPR